MGIENSNLYIKPEDKHTIRFVYPKHFEESALVQEIRLEIGSLAAWTPVTETNIMPFIVDDFKRTFPKMQIIATTHAPIVISSCEKTELIILEEITEIDETKKIVPKYPERSTKGWLAEDVLNEVMGIESSRNPEVEKDIAKFRDLYEKKIRQTLTKKEEESFLSLKDKLNQMLPSEDPITTMIGLESIDKYLKDF
jgi:hypothetical protein